MLKIDFVKIITGIVLLIIGVFILLSGPIGAIITGIILIILGTIIIFNKDENKIEKVKKYYKK